MLRALAYDSGKSLSLELGASQTIVKGDGLVWSSGYLVAAAAGEEIFDYVAQEAKTTAGGKYTFIDVLPASGSNIQYEVDTYANTAEAQRGVAYEAKTKSQIDNEHPQLRMDSLLSKSLVQQPTKKLSVDFYNSYPLFSYDSK